MIKQRYLPFIGIAILTLSLIAVNQAESGKAKDSEKAKDAQVQKRKQMIKAAKEQLNDTSWQIELSQMTARKKETDTLRFENYKIESEKLISAGFSPTNFTVSIKGGDVIVWETMQTSEEKGVAFWRGEIQNDVMRGVLSWQLNEDDKKDYTFLSVEKEIIQEEEMALDIQEEEKPEEIDREAVGKKPAEVKTEQAKKEEPQDKKIEKKRKKKRRRLFR